MKPVWWMAALSAVSALAASAASGAAAEVWLGMIAPLAVVIHDESLAEERDLVRAVGGAAALTLENERLGAEEGDLLLLELDRLSVQLRQLFALTQVVPERRYRE